jgi:hypothetical protein
VFNLIASQCQHEREVQSHRRQIMGFDGFGSERGEQKRDLMGGDRGGGRSQQCNQMLRKGHKILCLLDDRPTKPERLSCNFLSSFTSRGQRSARVMDLFLRKKHQQQHCLAMSSRPRNRKREGKEVNAKEKRNLSPFPRDNPHTY